MKNISTQNKWSIGMALLDWVLVFLMLGVAKLFDFLVPPFERKFSLNDLTISYPLTENETINNTWLWLLGLVFPAIIVLIVALLRKNWREGHTALLGLFTSSMLAYLITHFVKNLAGRPRPDFLARCVPDLKDGIPVIAAVMGLNDKSICLQSNMKIVRAGFQSFFSGHTSTSFSGLTFLSFYLVLAVKKSFPNAIIVRLWVGVIPLLVATFVMLSRVSDYRHHWQDVVVGMIVGIFAAIISFWQRFPEQVREVFESKCYSPSNENLLANSLALDRL